MNRFAWLLVLLAAACNAEGQGAETPIRIQEGTVCAAFAGRVDTLARQHAADVAGFLQALQREFVGGSGDPFAMRDALRAGRWNQRYFYAGHGGFRAPYDDNRPTYRDGGNHQPGHFVAVLSVAAQFGEDAARVAIAEAGDYNASEEDDLRLSGVAIPLGVGLRSGATSPAQVAARVRTLCR